jgi:hypothetical protein
MIAVPAAALSSEAVTVLRRLFMHSSSQDSVARNVQNDMNQIFHIDVVGTSHEPQGVESKKISCRSSSGGVQSNKSRFFAPVDHDLTKICPQRNNLSKI